MSEYKICEMKIEKIAPHAGHQLPLIPLMQHKLDVQFLNRALPAHSHTHQQVTQCAHRVSEQLIFCPYVVSVELGKFNPPCSMRLTAALYSGGGSQ